MYGEYIGIIDKLADNIVYEHNGQNVICIVLDHLPEASLHLRPVLEEFGPIYTTDLAMKQFNLSVPVEEYLDKADKLAAGEVRAFQLNHLTIPFLQFGSSLDLNIQLVLSQNATVEGNFALAPNKNFHPLAQQEEFLAHPVIGWRVAGNRKEEITDYIVENSLKQPCGEYQPTLNHLAWVKEATAEIKYVASRVFNK